MSAHYLQLQPRWPGGIKVQLCRSRIFSWAGPKRPRHREPALFPSFSFTSLFRLPRMRLWFQIQASLKTKPKKAFQFRQILKKMKPMLGGCSLKKRSRTCLVTGVVFNPFISDTPSHAAAFSICPHASCILKVPV